MWLLYQYLTELAPNITLSKSNIFDQKHLKLEHNISTRCTVMERCLFGMKESIILSHGNSNCQNIKFNFSYLKVFAYNMSLFHCLITSGHLI